MLQISVKTDGKSIFRDVIRHGRILKKIHNQGQDLNSNIESSVKDMHLHG